MSAPRTPNFNMHAQDHHPLLANAPALDIGALPFIDRHMRDRLGTLMSIDDVVAGLVNVLQETGVLDNTYVLFSSDHGCQYFRTISHPFVSGLARFSSCLLCS